ncbi:MAG: dihydrofolate reductase family protein [Acidobacteria bacterium]|nr:dihydrofolate reductase family protein [Acidobacteriota bacterium]MCA1638097.1 dihydrofolate reductase family protein [Acidobacteriota bacterium]
MRKVKYLVASTLDGFIARPDGSVDWLIMDGTDYRMGEFFKSIDAVLLGRKTYEFALRHSSKPEGKDKSKGVEGDTSPDSGMKNYVFSSTMKNAPDDGLEIISENAGEFVRNLKSETGKDIWLMGGGELAKSLLAENVVDEISLNVHPILLGAGLPLFPETGKQIDLELTECKSHKNGCVQVTYRVKH